MTGWLADLLGIRSVIDATSGSDAELPQRRKIRFVSGTGIADNPSKDATDVGISGEGDGGGGTPITYTLITDQVVGTVDLYYVLWTLTGYEAPSSGRVHVSVSVQCAVTWNGTPLNGAGEVIFQVLVDGAIPDEGTAVGRGQFIRTTSPAIDQSGGFPATFSGVLTLDEGDHDITVIAAFQGAANAGDVVVVNGSVTIQNVSVS